MKHKQGYGYHIQYISHTMFKIHILKLKLDFFTRNKRIANDTNNKLLN
jgi:hypothetical protein